MLKLEWQICHNKNQPQGRELCRLFDLHLPTVTVKSGVYIIWYGGPESHPIDVGSGIIKDRLEDHRNDPQIEIYKTDPFLTKGGIVYVTFAKVSILLQKGVERYLAETLDLVGSGGKRYPKKQKSIPVNLPDFLPFLTNS